MDSERPGDPDPLLSGAYRDLQTPGSSSCPGDEALVALALRELPAEERDRVADHMVSCRRCATDYRILLATHEEAGREIPEAWGERATPASPRWRLLALAASLVIAVAGVAFVARWNRGAASGHEDTLRGGGAALEEQVAPKGDAELASPPAEFAWPAQNDADRYRVKLFDSSGELLWESPPAPQPRAALPEAARSRLSAGQSDFWVVEVEAPLQRVRLGPFSFSLRSGGS